MNFNSRLDNIEKHITPTDKSIFQIIFNATKSELINKPYPKLLEKYKDAPIPELEDFELRREATALLLMKLSSNHNDRLNYYLSKFEYVSVIGIIHGKKVYEENQSFGKRYGSKYR